MYWCGSVDEEDDEEKDDEEGCGIKDEGSEVEDEKEEEEEEEEEDEKEEEGRCKVRQVDESSGADEGTEEAVMREEEE